jgi:tRNA G37 N-methylase TrmD
VLTAGDHGAVAAWRLERARERTELVRPDLLDASAHGASRPDTSTDPEVPSGGTGEAGTPAG